ncbi:MAG: hypothetical protein M3Q51_07035 [Pseudomonadota bacterium]|nr:hypothetical protein [Pseudomonadota bacterium]MDQ3160765.1 hypothetical protein [Pseudomonadota bacterium]
MKTNRIAAVVLGMATAATALFSANANHSWANYHWGSTTNTFVLQALDSTVANSNANWPNLLAIAATEWSQAADFDVVVVAAAKDSNTRRKCAAVAGKIRVCNQSYGKNGWLGLASININGDHITQGTAKMNDSYTSTWTSDPNEARHVMCQEVGHDFGLGHTSEDGSSQGTCMDYSRSAASISPNSHDYAQLASMYSHLDSTNTYSTSSANSTQQSMAGQLPMGVRVQKGRDFEIWAAPDGRGGTWIHHVTLAAE